MKINNCQIGERKKRGKHSINMKNALFVIQIKCNRHKICTNEIFLK